MPNKLKVLIADDSFLVRERLSGLLSSLSEVEVVGQARDAYEATTEIRRLQPDAVVLDIHMPPADGSTPHNDAAIRDGIDVLTAIKQDARAPYIIILSNYHYTQYREKCMLAGADAFLHKTKEFDRVPELLLDLMRSRDHNGREAAAADDHAADGATTLDAHPTEAHALNGHDIKPLPQEIKSRLRVPYALRRVPPASFAFLLPCPRSVHAGDALLVRLEKMGRNTRFELASGRLCNLHEGDLMAVAVGNRYATEQFEGYADIDGQFCDLLSMGGLCGLVKSKHAGVPDPTRLRILGAIGTEDGRALHLRDYALPPVAASRRPRTIVVCGTSMDSGKTYTAFSLIFGLQSQGHRVGAYKLTGTAAGRDTWSMLDAGADPVLDFIDGGHPSTYLCQPEELLDLHDLLSGHVAVEGADWLVIEVADGLLQAETAALLQSPRFTSTVDAFIFAAGDPLAATGGVSVLRTWGIEPIALSGRFTMSPLGIKEAKAATGLPCLTARKLQYGDLNERLVDLVGGLEPSGSPKLRAFETRSR